MLLFERKMNRVNRYKVRNMPVRDNEFDARIPNRSTMTHHKTESRETELKVRLQGKIYSSWWIVSSWMIQTQTITMRSVGDQAEAVIVTPKAQQTQTTNNNLQWL